MPRSALIVGATGLVGGHLLRLIQEDKDYTEVIVLARKPISSATEKVVQHIFDFDHLDQHQEKVKAGDIFCCIGTTMSSAGSKAAFYKVDYTYALTLAKISLENNASSFNLVSAMGSNETNFFFYNKVKGQLENSIKSLGFKLINVLRPSLIIGDRQEKRFFESFAKYVSKAFPFIYSGSLKKYKPIEAETIARALLRSAKYGLSGVHFINSDEIENLGQERKKAV